MTRLSLFLLLFITSHLITAQTRATQALHEKYRNGSFTMFFYKSTLRMLDNENSKEFHELVKDIEKAKLLKINKIEQGFKEEDHTDYLNELNDIGYEEIMTIRESGENINIFLKESNGKTDGIILLINSEEFMSLLDIIGKIDLRYIVTLASKLNLTQEN